MVTLPAAETLFDFCCRCRCADGCGHWPTSVSVCTNANPPGVMVMVTVALLLLPLVGMTAQYVKVTTVPALRPVPLACMGAKKSWPSKLKEKALPDSLTGVELAGVVKVGGSATMTTTSFGRPMSLAVKLALSVMSAGIVSNSPTSKVAAVGRGAGAYSMARTHTCLIDKYEMKSPSD